MVYPLGFSGGFLYMKKIEKVKISNQSLIFRMYYMSVNKREAYKKLSVTNKNIINLKGGLKHEKES